jgi:hypothetical protein
MTQHLKRPSQAARPDAPADPTAAAAPTTDESPGEDGKPTDMDYYRVGEKSGAMMLLGTIAIPLAVIVGIVVVLLLTL